MSETENLEKDIELSDEDVVLERIYIVPLWRVRSRGRGLHRAKKAVRYLREFISRHMKNPNVKISTKVNEEIWSRGIRNPPRRIKVKAVLTKEDIVWVLPAKD